MPGKNAGRFGEVEFFIGQLHDAALRQLVRKCIEAKAAGDYGVMSSDERLTVGIVLKRVDWLARMGYSIDQAIDTISVERRPLLADAERFVTKHTGMN